MVEIRIDEEFSNIIPPLKPEEFEQLKVNIIRDGCRDPLVVWTEKRVIIDGHNRYRICTENEIPYLTSEKSFENRDDVLDWIDCNQLGRRNLTPDQLSLIRGRRYNRAKKGEHDGGKGKERSGDQNEPNLRTSEILAKEHGVSPATVKRDGSYSSNVDKLKHIVPDIEQRINSTDKADQVTKAEIKIAADLIEKHPEAAVAIVTKHNHRAIGTGENEWYTPIEYIKAAKDVFGDIDLDPASSEQAQETVMAKSFFTIDDDGLSKEWFGKVWLNPPYQQPDIKNFIQKAVDEYSSGNIQEAIILTHNYTDTSWFHSAAAKCSAICFTRGRIGFLSPEGKKAAPTQGQAFFYFGNIPDKFVNVFAGYGQIFTPKTPGY